MFQETGTEHDTAATRWPFAEPEVALSEGNHRIANNLALLASTIALRASEISRTGAPIESEEVAQLLAEIGARIETVGRLHRLLSTRPQAACLDVNECLFELCETLVAALAAPGLFRLIWPYRAECMIAADKVLPLCLIVTEIVTNSLKYAHPAGAPGELAVACRCDAEGTLMIEIADDGVGLPEGFEFTAGGGLGARTIMLLARKLEAAIQFQSPAIGLRTTLRVPRAREPN
jgi:two-component sensor histidine kinase